MTPPIQNPTTEAAEFLRQIALGLADAGLLTPSGQASIIDDAIHMGVPASEARRIVAAVAAGDAAAARARLAGRLGGREAPGLPTIPPTDDGFVLVLRRADWSLRWNVRARRVEARHGDEGAWLVVDEVLADDIFTAVSKVALVSRGNQSEPWGVRSARMERRLLNVVARRSTIEGDGDAIFQTVTAWADDREPDTRIPHNEMLVASGCVNRYETAARTPRWVSEAARAALTAAGWEYKTARRPGKNPRMLWCKPATPTRPRRVVVG